MASLDAATTAPAAAAVNTERRRADRTQRDVLPEPIPAEVLNEPGAGLAAIRSPGFVARRLGMRLGPISGERRILASSEMGAVESGTQTTDGTLLAGNETIPSGDAPRNLPQLPAKLFGTGADPGPLPPLGSTGGSRGGRCSPDSAGKKRLTLGEAEYDT